MDRTGEMGNSNNGVSPPSALPTENSTGTPRGRGNEKSPFAPFGINIPKGKITGLQNHYKAAAQRFELQDVQGISEFPGLRESLAKLIDGIGERNSTLRLNEVSVYDKALTQLYEAGCEVAALMLFVAEYTGIVKGTNPFDKHNAAAQKLAHGGVIKEIQASTSGGAPSNGSAVSAAPANPHTSQGSTGWLPAQQPGSTVFSTQNGVRMAGTVALSQPAFPAGVGATQDASAQVASSGTHGLPAQSLSANFRPSASSMPDPVFAAASNGNIGGSANADIDPRLLNPQSTYLPVHGLFDGDDGSCVPQGWIANGNVGSGAQ